MRHCFWNASVAAARRFAGSGQYDSSAPIPSASACEVR
jgi:hypothetical protein